MGKKETTFLVTKCCPTDVEGRTELESHHSVTVPLLQAGIGPKPVREPLRRSRIFSPKLLISPIVTLQWRTRTPLQPVVQVSLSTDGTSQHHGPTELHTAYSHFRVFLPQIRKLIVRQGQTNPNQEDFSKYPGLSFSKTVRS